MNDDQSKQMVPSQPVPMASQNRPTMGILTPTSFGEAMEMSKILADSSIVPKEFQGKPGNVLIAVQWGNELGLQPLQAMQSIAVINGRPSIWGDAMLGLVQGSGALVDIREDLDEASMVATCTVVRRGRPEPIVRTFSMEDAKKAGLAGKQGPWQQYPKRMLQLRARGFALRDAFPDVLRGIAIAEEARDTPVMRDVTPSEDAESVTERVRAKVSKKKSEADATVAASLEEVMAAIMAAGDEAALNKAAEAARHLTGKDKDAARKAYGDRLTELREPKPGDVDEDGQVALTPEQAAEQAEAEARWRAQQDEMAG